MRQGWIDAAKAARVAVAAAAAATLAVETSAAAAPNSPVAPTGPRDDTPALTAGTPQAFAHAFALALTDDATTAVLDYIAPDLIDEFLRANGTVVNAPNRRIVVRNVLDGARGLVSIQSFAVAPQLEGASDAGDAVVRIDVRSAVTIHEADVERRKQAAADPELRWALGPDVAQRIATMSASERDAYFEGQLGTRIESSVPVWFAIAGSADSGYRVTDIFFGPSAKPLSRLPELVAQARGSGEDVARKRNLMSVRAIMFAIGALFVMLSLRRYRQQQREKRRLLKRRRRNKKPRQD